MLKPSIFPPTCDRFHLLTVVTVVLVFSCLSVLPAGSQTCGPPNYSCVVSCTKALTGSCSAIQTPAPPFTGSTTVNPIGYDSSMGNPSGAVPILRASDSSVLDKHSPSSTPSGGDNDEVFSCTGRTDTNYACAHATLYFLNVQYGGCDFVAGIQTTPSFQVVAPFPPHATAAYHPSPCGGLTWSHTDPSVAYYEGSNGGDPTLYKGFCTTICKSAHSTRLSGKRRIRS
jgi:hypothetical protein